MHASKDSMWRVEEEIFWVCMASERGLECLDGEHAGTEVMMEIRMTRTDLPSVLNSCNATHVWRRRRRHPAWANLGPCMHTKAGGRGDMISDLCGFYLPIARARCRHEIPGVVYVWSPSMRPLARANSMHRTVASSCARYGSDLGSDSPYI
jgi:hypothetical protein